MKIIESKNLIYQKSPFIQDGVSIPNSPKKCLLEKIDLLDEKLALYFKNRTLAVITAKNLEGEKELRLIAGKLKDFIGKSYEEILNFDF
ncbi:MAG: hypothetical protein COT33_01320 [Candidatus Nealsonbacteria bacterium CG08_land_8_20_14_0_20_38_20]|uniref:Uncharacterized protein n=1 Tax=Candidatus Nealsonbacteria bacterium CG08_land_8_20_14_0_20_38_20 TaxID=1974705 RepID=A0A2H0YM22_9BACT|nr:MAG: hypothetical protein COT33_01320 [Candidatus Nealsonbacteria bacterium CG08_land_8_20_14_0_20_38_20]